MNDTIGLTEKQIKEALKQIFDADDTGDFIAPFSSGAKLISIVIGFLEAFDGEFETTQNDTRFVIQMTKEEL